MIPIELKVISYEEERLEYFKTRRSYIQKRFDRLKRVIDKKESVSYLSEDFNSLTKLGREISFYDDVINILENMLTQNKEEDISCDVCACTLLEERDKARDDIGEIFESLNCLLNEHSKGFISDHYLYRDIAELEKKYEK